MEARRTVEETFALPAVVTRYVGIYRSLIAGTWPDCTD
jgi:hypothetical protein